MQNKLMFSNKNTSFSNKIVYVSSVALKSQWTETFQRKCLSMRSKTSEKSKLCDDISQVPVTSELWTTWDMNWFSRFVVNAAPETPQLIVFTVTKEKPIYGFIPVNLNRHFIWPHQSLGIENAYQVTLESTHLRVCTPYLCICLK